MGKPEAVNSSAMGWDRHLVEMVPDLVCVCRDGMIDRINQAGAQLLGFASAAAAQRQAFAERIHGDFAEIVSAGLDVLAEDGQPVPLMLQRVDGRIVEVELSAQLAGPGTLVIHARDITERTHAAEAILRNEERYRRLVDLALDFTCLTSEGVVTFINAAGVRMLAAADAQSILGRSFGDLVHPDYREVVAVGLAELAEEPGPLPMKFVRVDGLVIDVEVAILPFGAASRDVFMIEARDVTERTRRAEAVREREQRLQGIMDTVAEGIVTADEAGVIQSLNPAAQRIFGYTAAEAVGRNLSLLMPEPYAGEHDGYMADYVKSGKPKVLGIGREVSGKRKDGTIFPVDVNVAELRLKRQRLFIGIIRDITERKRAEEALKRARDELETRVEERTRELRRLSRQTAQILDSASEGIIGLDHDGHITFVNPAAAEMTGWSVPALIDRPLNALLTPPEAAGKPLPAGATLCGVLMNMPETVFWRRDGSSFPVELACAPIEENGAIVGAVAVFRDVTERKRAEEKLRLAATVFETTTEAILVLDAEHHVTAVNPAFTDITGFTADEAVGRPPSFLTSGLQDAEFYRQMWETVGGHGSWQGELWNLHKNGRQYAERLAISVITDERGAPRHYVVVFSDITQRKQDEERIRYQANYDALTGLPNRALFLDRLNQAVVTAGRAGQMVGLMFIDLDGFKLVNDTLGHDLGDALLKEAGNRLLDCVRSGDTVARLGGDEFTVIMPNLGDFQNAPLVASRIIEALERPFDLHGKEAFVSASIGITTFPNDAADPPALLKNADAAMYRAKEQGKANFQFFTADMNDRVAERLTIKNGLVKALERDEFMLYYQPKVDLARGGITGVEALLRWRNAELGPVSPVKFIPVMEETGLIGPVGEWALEVACRQYRAWLDQGHRIRVAVNLSVRQLRQPDLAGAVARVLEKVGIGPEGLELEITESMIMKDTENAVATLQRLHDMGIHLAMDDFGTGYSSLSYLKRFPLDTIKIDRSFVNDIAVDPDDLEIIRTIITMGHSLRRRIVAEGVETEEQRAILHRLNCDEIQGYLVSPPVPAEMVTRLLNEQSTVG